MGRIMEHLDSAEFSLTLMKDNKTIKLEMLCDPAVCCVDCIKDFISKFLVDAIISPELPDVH